MTRKPRRNGFPLDALVAVLHQWPLDHSGALPTTTEAADALKVERVQVHRAMNHYHLRPLFNIQPYTARAAVMRPKLEAVRQLVRAAHPGRYGR